MGGERIKAKLRVNLTAYAQVVDQFEFCLQCLFTKFMSNYYWHQILLINLNQ
jgi:hypothetical protein